MKTTPYKAKSLSGAQTRVRQLERLVSKQSELLSRFDKERKLLAMLAADTPQFYNPLVIAKAKQIRNSILALPSTRLAL